MVVDGGNSGCGVGNRIRYSLFAFDVILPSLHPYMVEIILHTFARLFNSKWQKSIYILGRWEYKMLSFTYNIHVPTH